MLGPLAIYKSVDFSLVWPFWTHTESVFRTVSTIGISTTRPSRWSPRCIIFSMSFFTHFSDIASHLGLHATSVVLHFAHCWYRQIPFFELMMMLEISSHSHLVQFQTLRPYTLPHQFARHIGRHQIISHFLHEPTTPVILQMFRYFATIHSPRKEAHQCFPPTLSPSHHKFSLIEHFLLAWPLIQSLLVCFQTP